MKWKHIPGWVGFYEVSQCGKIRSVDRLVLAWHPTGRRIWRKFQGRVLVPGGKKYLMVKLTRPGKAEYKNVHELVLRAWRGKPKRGHESCHNNGDGKDNRLSNLRWDTRKANAEDRERHKL